MDEILNKKNISRRDFLQLAAIGMSAAAVASYTGCKSLPDKKDYKTLHKKLIKYKNCNIIDVNTGKVSYNSSILVADNQIVKISHNKDIKIVTKDIKIIDLQGKYIIPGLIDAHVHLTLTGVAGFEMADLLPSFDQFDINFHNHIKSGVTSVRDMGATPYMLHSKMKNIEKGKLIGPRVVYCNRFLNIKGSHPSLAGKELDFVPRLAVKLTGGPSVHFETLDELKKEIIENADKGASFIKLTLDNKSLFCGKDELPEYTEEMLKFIFDYAEKNNLPIAGHHQYKFGFDRALKYPFHSLEHLPSDLPITDLEAQKFVDNGTALIPTCTVGNLLSYDEWERFIPDNIKNDEFIKNEIKMRREFINGLAKNYEEEELHETNVKFAEYYKKYNEKELIENNIYIINPIYYYKMMYIGFKNLIKLKKAGALIGCGTDAGIGFNYHGTLWYEMSIMQRLGFTPLEILKSATVNNAKILKMEDKIGTIEEGKYADFTVLKGNPLEKDFIDTIREPVATIKDGLLLYINKELSDTEKQSVKI